LSTASRRRASAATNPTEVGLPLQITFRHLDHSAALESRIRSLVARLEKFEARITHCHVVVAAPPRHHRHDAFRAVRRKLEDYRRTRRGDIKNHSKAPRVRRRRTAD